MNNLEETDRKYLIFRRKGETRFLRRHKKKLLKGICLNNTKKVQISLEKYWYLGCTERRGDNGKEQ